MCAKKYKSLFDNLFINQFSCCMCTAKKLTYFFGQTYLFYVSWCSISAVETE